MTLAFTEFCQKNFPISVRFGDEYPDSEILWAGPDGTLIVHPFPRLIVRVALKESGISNRFDRLVVRIVNARDGEVDRKDFSFSEFLTTGAGTVAAREGGFHAWYRNGHVNWYVDHPTKIREELLRHVERYIQVFGLAAR